LLYHWLQTDKGTITGTALLAFAVFLTTLQMDINGDRGPFATDIGEIQNALPRWGILHFHSYPLYSLLGSAFVTLLRPLGIQPAMGASLYSAVWGAICVSLLVAIALAIDVPPLASAGGGLILSLSTSMWIDSSIAEIHTMTTALMLGALLAAVRYGRDGQRRDLLWLAFLTGQAVAHQPASVLLGPALVVLILRQWRGLPGMLWRTLPAAIGLALLGPLTYLYLPIRAWQGADWVYGSPGTWQGFRQMMTYKKSRTVMPASLAGWLEQGERTIELLADDLPLVLLALGLIGLLWAARKGRWPEALGLSLVWVAYLGVSIIIWEGRVSDAQLAAKIPVLAMAALGIAVLIGVVTTRWRWFGTVAAPALLVVAGLLYADHRSTVLDITREPKAEQIIAVVSQIEPARDGEPIALTALWGMDYWALAYAQEYREGMPDFELVRHNANFEAILERGAHLVTPAHTFYAWSPERWKRRLGDLYLSSFAPEVIEMSPVPLLGEMDLPPAEPFPLGNGVTVRHASVAWKGAATLHLVVYWQAEEKLEDHSIAVHLVSQDPPTGPQDILVQADRDHPVGGWYPTSQWRPGEIVRDTYPMQVPLGTTPRAVRLSMYRSLGDGQFLNTEWLSIPVPPRPAE
jgi:hypothetical protein